MSAACVYIPTTTISCGRSSGAPRTTGITRVAPGANHAYFYSEWSTIQGAAVLDGTFVRQGSMARGRRLHVIEIRVQCSAI